MTFSIVVLLSLLATSCLLSPTASLPFFNKGKAAPQSAGELTPEDWFQFYDPQRKLKNPNQVLQRVQLGVTRPVSYFVLY
jgi:hypothetical protein